MLLHSLLLMLTVLLPYSAGRLESIRRQTVILGAPAPVPILVAVHVPPSPGPPRSLPAPVAPTPAPTIAADCQVTIDGRPAKLEDLRAGMEAIFILDQGVIVQIIAVTVKK